MKASGLTGAGAGVGAWKTAAVTAGVATWTTGAGAWTTGGGGGTWTTGAGAGA